MLANVKRMPMVDELSMVTQSDAADINTFASHSAVYAETIDVVCGLISNSAKTVEDSTQELNGTFALLAAGAKSQAQQIQNIMDNSRELELAGERFSIQEFIGMFGTTLTNLMEKIVFISEMSMRMAYHLDEASEHLGALESFVSKITRINKETNLLALNAAIEASRFGKEGKGFEVVAGEVKGVSQGIQALTTDMNKHIGAVAQSLRASYDVTRKLATTDMTENILAREKLELMLGGLIEQNSRFTQVMQGAVDDSAKISDTISRAVIGMQFQDRNSQQIGNAVTVLRQAATHLRNIPGDPAHDEVEIARIADVIAGQFTLSEFRKALIAQLASQGMMQATEAATKTAPRTTTDDDIELF